MDQLPQSLVNIQETIVSAVGKLGGSTGVSLKDIQQYLSTVLDKVPGSESIQSYLNDAVDKGFLTKLDDGKYKQNSAKESDQSTMSSVTEKIGSYQDSGRDKIKESAKNAKEDAKSTVSSVDEKFRSGVDSGKDKIEKYGRNAKEVAKDTKNNFEKEFYAIQGKEESKETGARSADENMSTGSDQGNLNFSAEKQDNTTTGKFVKENK